MSTLIAPRRWHSEAAATKHSRGLLAKWNTFMESQSESKTLWFLISLIFQGVFLLPVPAVLIYYYQAPVPLLALTLGLFFANIIAGMGGAGIKILLWLLAASLLIHTALILFFIV